MQLAEDVTQPLGAPSPGSIVGRLERIPFTRTHLRVAAILGTGTFFDAFDLLAIGIALTVVLTTFHMSFAAAGILISGAYAGQFVGGLVFGSLSERYGRKPAFIAALAVFGACALFAAFATSMQQLLIARVVQGLGLGAEVPLAGAMFNEFVRGRSRGKIVMAYEGMFVWGLFVAPLAGMILFRLLSPDLGWRVLFAVGAIPLVVALIAIKALPESPRWLAEQGRVAEADAIVGAFERDAQRAGTVLEAPVAVRLSGKPTDFGELFSPTYRARTWMSYALWFTTYFAMYGYSTWLPTLYVKLGGLPPSASLALTSLVGAIQLGAVYVQSATIDRVGRKPWFIASYVIALVGTLWGAFAVGVLHLSGWPILFTAGALMGIGAYTSGSAVYLYTPELFPTRMRVWATTTSASVCRIASTIAPAVVGVFLASAGGIGAVFVMFGIDLAIGLVIFARFAIETKGLVLEELAP
ncbi:MAG TPA: MFS transporter [Candidatus Limnocylindria bacterium]|nr:MFS transporter [Candidatus Limnocylindria bacterium]